MQKLWNGIKSYLFFLLLCALIVTCAPGTNNRGNNGGGNVTPETPPDYPVFSPIGGFFKEAQTVAIQYKEADAVIYYTTDTTEPTEASTKYTGPFRLDQQTVVRALAVQSDGKKAYAMTAFDFDLDRGTDFKGTRAASPNWQDQVIYFLMTDRFYNGTTSNDKDPSFSYNENQALESHYNGGDFVGIEQKLDYIKDLGATAIWITPPVKNQVHEGFYHGYHGYWASDFTQTDFHFGTLEEYQSFVSKAHEKGLYVIQDIVVNHTGDYMKIGETVTASMLANKPLPGYVFKLNPSSIPTMQPEQLPWSMNNPNLYTEDELRYSSFYNWRPIISDFGDESQLLTFQMSDLDDMKTTNPVVQNLLRGYFRYWIDKANIDGYRIDTVSYVQPEFFEDFIHGTQSGNEGVREYARKAGKNDFISFGEAWNQYDTKVAPYTKDPQTGKKRIDSIIYFPLTFVIRDVLSGGRATNLISEVLNQRYTIGYDNPDRMVTFIDNHDIDRLIKNTNKELVRAAYAIIMTIPGIPQIYYGSEQGFYECRQAMFAGGYGEMAGQVNSADHFNTDADNEWYQFFQKIIALRKNHRIFRYNQLDIVADAKTSGIFSYQLTEKGANGQLLDGINHKALVILNTSSNEKVLNITCNFTEGDKLEVLAPSHPSFPNELMVKKGSQISFIVPPQGYGIYLLKEEGHGIVGGNGSVKITSQYQTVVTSNEITVNGTVDPANSKVKIVFNGDFTNAKEISVSGTSFSETLPIKTLSNGENEVEAILDTGDPSTYVYSNKVYFQLERPYEKLNTFPTIINDPEGDDTGPAGKTYGLPTDATFAGHQQDITKVELKASGSDLCIEITMKSISKIWNPTINLFDHVLFSIFFAKPGSTSGCSVHPNQNYTLPDGFQWDYMLKAEGWGSSFFSSIGASATKSGEAVTPAPTSEVDWSGETAGMKTPGVIKFYIKAASLGFPETLEGWKIYINTYDTDTGKLRGMDPAPSQWKFSGGSMATDPLVIDETEIITILATD